LGKGYPSELIHNFAVIDAHSLDKSLLMSPKLEVSTTMCWAQSRRRFWIVSSIHFWFTVGWRLDFGTIGVAQSFIDSSHAVSSCLNRKGSDEMPEMKTSQIASLRCTSAVTSSWSQSLESCLNFCKKSSKNCSVCCLQASRCQTKILLLGFRCSLFDVLTASLCEAHNLT